MANVPVFNTDNISLGPGIVKIGPTGTTPSVDIGAISEDGLTITVSQEFLEVFQGSPKQRIKQFKTDENLEATISGIEWNLVALAQAMGAGVTTSSGSLDTFAFGGDPNTAEVAVLVEHTMPVGHTINFIIWKAQPTGEWELNMAQDELQSFPYSFKGLVATQNWGNEALPVGEQLFRITRQKA